MGKKNNNSNLAENLVEEEIAPIDIAVLASLVSLVGQSIGLFSLILQSQALHAAEIEESASSLNTSTDEFSPERFRRLEKQVQYLTKELERLRR